MHGRVTIVPDVGEDSSNETCLFKPAPRSGRVHDGGRIAQPE